MKINDVLNENFDEKVSELLIKAIKSSYAKVLEELENLERAYNDKISLKNSEEWNNIVEWTDVTIEVFKKSVNAFLDYYKQTGSTTRPEFNDEKEQTDNMIKNIELRRENIPMISTFNKTLHEEF